MYSAFCFHLAEGFNLANPHAALLVVNNLTNGKLFKVLLLDVFVDAYPGGTV